MPLLCVSLQFEVRRLGEGPKEGRRPAHQEKERLSLEVRVLLTSARQCVWSAQMPPGNCDPLGTALLGAGDAQASEEFLSGFRG